MVQQDFSSEKSVLNVNAKKTKGRDHHNFSLRRNYPDQVLRVWSQPHGKRDTPKVFLKRNYKIKPTFCSTYDKWFYE